MGEQCERDEALPFYKGQTFPCYNALAEYLAKYDEYFQTSTDKSHKNKDTENQTQLETFPLKDAHIICRKGKKFESKGQGLRNVKSGKTDCPFYFSLLKPAKKQHYVITKCTCMHNHQAQLEVGDNFNQSFKDLYEMIIQKYAQKLQDEAIIDAELVIEKIIGPDRVLEQLSEHQIQDTIKQEVKESNIESNSIDKIEEKTQENLTEESQKKLSGELEKESVQSLGDSFKNKLCLDSVSGVHEVDEKVTVEPEEDTGTKKKLVVTGQIKQKGRKKGKVTSAIGLPFKKDCIAFVDLSEDDQIKRILRWLGLDIKFIKTVIDDTIVIPFTMFGKKFQEIPEQLTSEDINFDVLNKHLAQDTKSALLDAVKEQKPGMIYLCRKCEKLVTEETASIECCVCLKWVHAKCDKIKITEAMQEDSFKYFCKTCLACKKNIS